MNASNLEEMSLATRLTVGLQALALPLSTPQQQQLLDYVALLAKWNRHYNLTAVRDPQQMVPRHLLDSLTLLPYLQGSHLLDIGSGAGLPGVPLAIAAPERHFTLLDSNGKKCRFITQAVAELRITNLSVVHCRVEQFQPPQRFDTIMARAFADMATITAVAAPRLAPQGQILAMKGVVPLAELEQLPSGWHHTTIALQVPTLDQAQRHLIRLVAAPASTLEQPL